MNIVTLISELAQQDIRLWLEQDNLRYSAPDGAMTADVIANLREHKPAIIAFLQQSAQQQSVSFSKLTRGSVAQGYEVSAAQQRLWFLQQLEPENSAYHIHAALMLEGPLQIDHLNKALNTIQQRHEVLRSSYQQQDGKLQQFIHAPTNIMLQATALEKETGEEQALHDAIQQHLHQRFDLSESVFRCQLWQLSPQRYAIAFTVHHIAADGWSLGIFVNELMALYQASIVNQPMVLAELSFQYIDFAHWQNQPEQQDKQQQQLSYWQQTLMGCPNLDLPLDRSRQALSDNRASVVNFTLNTQQTQGLKTLAQAQQGTLFMSLLTAYAILLQRYSQQQDFAIGTPVAGRNLSQLEPMIGCFVNVLAIRCEMDDSLSFQQLLQQQVQQCTQAFEHQDVPFEQVVNALNTSRDLSQTPVFQTMLSLQNTPFQQDSELQSLKISPIDYQELDAQFDLKLTVTEAETQLQCQFEFKQALFNGSTIEHMAGHFSRLIDCLLADSQQPVHAIDLFSSDALQQRLQLESGQDNATTLALPDCQLLHKLFEQQVQKNPQAIATSDSQQSLSYEELNLRANQLAATLIENGLASESLVGVCMTRSVHMLTALLAVLKSGCAYVPMDPDFPIQRLQFIGEDTAIAHLLMDDDSAAIGQALSDNTETAITNSYIINNAFFSDKASAANPTIQQANNSLFNVIYTSGSTGTPKGVMVPHAGICNRLLWMQDSYALSVNDKVLQKTPYSFDVSVWELFWPIITGSQSYFADKDGHKDPGYLRDIMQRQQITTAHFVPSMLSVFLQTPEIEQCRSLRQVFCSGEALQQEQQNRFFTRLPNSSLHNLYGPTEASIDVSFYDCSSAEDYASVPIGKAIANTQLHILDNQLRPLPCGIAGELYIGGANLARGYLNREELTASTFIDNPFHTQGHPSAKLYKTGDLVRLSEDGNILYMGRLDHQLKIRGNRIELGEIEKTITDIAGVQEAIVKACPSSDGTDQLIAYYIADENLDSEHLPRITASSLPSYMQPAAFIAVAAWPLTANGKINRNKLPQPDWAEINQQAYVAPESDTEKQLAAIWAEVLQLPQVGIDDNFFHVGGHSLTATEALAKAQEAFAVEVPLRAIFENPNIRHIAQLLDEAIMQQAVFSDNQTDANSDEDEDMETFVL